MTKQSLLNGSINKSLHYLSFDCGCYDVYIKLHGLIINEIDDIMKGIHIRNINHYYIYDRTEFNKIYFIITYNSMDRIKRNIMNNQRKYVLLNLLCLLVLYETIWIIVSILLVFIVTKHLGCHCFDVFAYIIGEKNINNETFLRDRRYTRHRQ